MNPKTNFYLFAGMMLTAVSAQANSVLTYNFDSTIPSYKYGYVYSELGTGAQDNGVFSATGGNAGTGGVVATFDTTPMSGGWAGFGLGFGDWAGAGNYAALVNAKSLADITVSFDVRAGGLTGTSAGVKFELKLESPDNTLSPSDANTDADALLTLTLNKDITSTFQTFTSTLDTWTISNGTFAQLQTYLGTMQNINFNIAYDAGGTLAAFGNDTGNIIAADNFSVTVVPEPSALALLSLGGIIMLIARRR